MASTTSTRTTTTTTNHDGPLLPPGSPISPKSVTMISNFQQQQRKHFDGGDFTKIPDMMGGGGGGAEEEVEPTEPTTTTTTTAKFHTKEEEEPLVASNSYSGSSPCYRFFTARPNPEMLLPTLRIVADATNGGGGLGEQQHQRCLVQKTIVDDILIHRLGLQQSYPNLFVGYTGMPPARKKRIVLTRLASDNNNNNDRYGMYCCDEDQAQQVLMTLRCFQVQID